MLSQLMKTLSIITIASSALVISTNAQSGEVKLSAASCLPIGSPPSLPFEALVKNINERGKGVIQIDLIGGAPAIGNMFTLANKLSKGVYDMLGCPEAFGSLLPEAPVFHLAEKPYSELRKNGGLKYLTDLLEAKGIHYVGRHHTFGPFYLWLGKKIDKPDLTGLHLRTSPAYTTFFRALGATVQTSGPSQIYSYMENGTVQGFGWPALAWIPSFTSVTKYRVEPGFHDATLHTLTNQKKWKSLSDEQRDLISSVVMEFEKRSEIFGAEVQSKLDKLFAKLDKQGLKAIKFEGADADKWLKTAKDTAWAEVLEKSPEHGPKLKKLWTK